MSRHSRKGIDREKRIQRIRRERVFRLRREQLETRELMSGAATFLRIDATTKGAWRSEYGLDGFNISQDSSAGNPDSAPYASVTITGAQGRTWASSTADPRALARAASASSRIAADWHTSTSMDIDLDITDGLLHQVALYALDWDGAGARSERIDVIDDASGTVLDSRTLTNFNGGQYAVWSLTGDLTLRVTNTSATSDASVSGLFFGGAHDANWAYQPIVGTAGVSTDPRTLAGFEFIAAPTGTTQVNYQFLGLDIGPYNWNYYWYYNYYAGYTTSWFQDQQGDRLTFHDEYGYRRWIDGYVEGYGYVYLTQPMDEYGNYYQGTDFTSSDGWITASLSGAATGSGSSITVTRVNGKVGLNDYSASIDWGDGTSEPARLVQDGGSNLNAIVSVHTSGAHTYQQPGEYVVRVTVASPYHIYSQGGVDHGSQYVVETLAKAVPQTLSLFTTDFEATRGASHDGVVARFHDSDPQSEWDYSATVDWGDNTQSDPGSWYGGSPWISDDGQGNFSVHAGHTYGHSGSSTLQVTIQRTGGPKLVGTSGTATILAVPASAATVAVETEPLTLAHFGFEARITGDWSRAERFEYSTDQPGYGNSFYEGDGYLQVYYGGQYVYGYLYGIGYVSMWTDGGGVFQSWDGKAIARMVGSGPGSYVEVLTTQTLTSVGEFHATIDWGDGTSSVGQIVLDGTAYLGGYIPAHVEGRHTYAQRGDYDVRVTVTSANGMLDDYGRHHYDDPLVARSRMAVVPQTLSLIATDFEATRGSSYNGVVARFQDSEPGPAQAYSARITWGDGTTDSGWVSDTGLGYFAVHGSHAYKFSGSAPVSVTVQRANGPMIRGASGTATIWAVAPLVATVAKPTGDTTLAHFSYFSAQSWDDATTFAWAGNDTSDYWEYYYSGYSHAWFLDNRGNRLDYNGYRGRGGWISGYIQGVGWVYLSDDNYDGDFTSSYSTNHVEARIVDYGPGGRIEVLGQQNGVQLSEFAATIDWGDGTSGPGRLVLDGAAAPNTYAKAIVVGDHVYSTPGDYEVQVSVTGPGGVFDDDGRHSYGTQLLARAQLKAVPQTIAMTAGSPVIVKHQGSSSVLATFTDSDADSDEWSYWPNYEAEVWWGDGTSSTVPVYRQGDGSYTVPADHSYPYEGKFDVRVRVEHVGGAWNDLTLPVTVWGASPIVAVAAVPVVNAPLTTFEFRTGYDWGHATNYAFVGESYDTDYYYYNEYYYHTYHYQGAGGASLDLRESYYYGGSHIDVYIPGVGSVRLNDSNPGYNYYWYDGTYTSSDGRYHAQVMSLGADGHPASPTSYPGWGTSILLMGPDGVIDITKFHATVDWGDGTQSQGQLEPTGGDYSYYYYGEGLAYVRVLGSHTYSAPGSYTVRTTITGPGDILDDQGRHDYGAVLVSPLPVTVYGPASDDSYEIHANNTLYAGPWYYGRPSVTANDQAARPGHQVSVSLAANQGTAHGSLSLNVDGSFVYTPAAGYVGPDSFVYDLLIDSQYHATATARINVTDDAPRASDATFSLPHDRTYQGDVSGSAHDGNNDPLTFALGTGPAHGTIQMQANGRFSYQPAANYVGDDSFGYVVSDGALSAAATVTLHAINRAPTVDPINLRLRHDSLVWGWLSLYAHDADGDALTYTLVSSGGGALQLDAFGRFTYNPASGFMGAATFTFTVSDGIATTTATATLDVTDAAPVAGDDAYDTLTHSRPVTVYPLLNDRDSDGDSITPTITQPLAHGQVIILANGAFQITPEANYVGTDILKYKVFDGVTWSNEAVVHLTFKNAAPVADSNGVHQSFTISHDRELDVTSTSQGILSNDTDADNDKLIITLVKLPEHGRLHLHGYGTFVYVPDPGYISEPGSPDYFTYQVDDGIASSEIVPVYIDVVNSAPVASNDEFYAVHDRPLVGNVVTRAGAVGSVADVDADGDPFTVRVVSGPASGTLMLRPGGEFLYAPSPGFSGDVSFTYAASDGIVEGAPATVTIHVGETAPTAQDDTFTVVHDRQLTVGVADLATWWNWMAWANRYSGYYGSILGNDGDREQDRLSILVKQTVAHGTLSFDSDGTFRYQPQAGWTGTDSFVYTASDGVLESNAATVSIQVVNHAPQPLAQSFTLGHGRVLSTYLGAGDSDGDAMTYVLDSPASSGTVTLQSNGAFTYNPATPNTTGPDSFTYHVTDGLATSASQIVRIQVNQSAPTVSGASYNVVHNTPISGWAQGRDAEGDALVYSLVGQAPSGLVFNSNGSYTYTPPSDTTGTVSFQYMATDGWLSSAAATISLLYVNRAPQIGFSSTAWRTGPNALGAPSKTSGTLAYDADGDPLQYTIERIGGSGALAGTLTRDGSLYTYQPNGTATGSESFRVTVSDGYNSPVQGTLNFEVAENAPVATDSTIRVHARGTFYGSLASPYLSAGGGFAVTDPDRDEIRTTILDRPYHDDGTFFLSSNGTFRYTPLNGFVGEDSMTFYATDGILQTGVATVRIQVFDNAPSVSVASSQFRTYPDTPVSMSVTAVDSDYYDVPFLTIAIDQLPAHGVITTDEGGRLTYTPDAGYSGPDFVTVSATDGILRSAPVRINVVVQASTVTARDDEFTLEHDHEMVADGSGVRQWSMVDGSQNQTSFQSSGLLRNDVSSSSTIRAVVQTPPAHGTVKIKPDGSFSYVPAAGYLGDDQFTYAATDGHGASSIATVRLHVINTAAPTAADDVYYTQPGLTLVAEGAGSAIVVSGPQTGRILRLDQPVHFGETSLASYLGLDRIDPNWRGRIGNQTVVANDNDSVDPLTVVFASDPGHGTLTWKPDGSFEYTPGAGFTGDDSFTYRVSDGNLQSGLATVVIHVQETAPTVTGEASYTIGRGKVLNMAAGQFDATGVGTSLRSIFNDAETSHLTVQKVSSPSHGTVVVNADGSFVYTPQAGFVGDDTFTVLANDGLMNSAAVAVHIRVTDTAPVAAANQEHNVRQNTALTMPVPAGSDADGDALTVQLLSGPSHGTFTLNGDGTFTYTPQTGYAGADIVSLTYSDGVLFGGFTLLTMSVVAHAPTAVADQYNVTSNGALAATPSVLANDTDPDGRAMTAAVVTPPSHAQSFTFRADGTFSYTPAAGFLGVDTFTYKAIDDWSGSLPVKVSILVQPGTFNDLGRNLIERQNFNGTVAYFATTDTQQGLTATIAWGDGSTSPGTVAPSGGQFLVNGNHTYSKPGTYSRVITITDGAGHSSRTTASVTVADAPPTITPATLNLTKRVPYSSVTVASFVDGNGFKASDYQARINWGDGTTTDGVVAPSGANTFTVSGSHRYLSLATYPVTVAVTPPGAAATSAAGSAVVTHHVTVKPEPIVIDSDGRIDATIATFNSNDPASFADQFLAVVSWGDGTQSLGTITGTSGAFNVYGRHRYSTPGSYHVSVDVTDDDPGAGNADFVVSTEPPPALVWQGNSLVLTEDRAPSAGLLLGTFVEADPTSFSGASDFDAYIRWGDGQVSLGTVVGDSFGGYDVYGAPELPFEDEGVQKISVEIHKLGVFAGTLNASMLVRGLPLTLQTPTVSFDPLPSEPQGFDGQIALLGDGPDPNSVASDYRVEIDWGDGLYTAGTLKPLGEGGYEIDTSRSFPRSGAYHAKIYVYEGDRSRASGEVTVNVNLKRRDPGSGQIPIDDISWGASCPDMFRVHDPNTPTGSGGDPARTPTVTDVTILPRGVTVLDASGGLLIARQSYSGLKLGYYEGAGGLSGFQAEVDWGDGTKSQGTISGQDILGDHSYDSFGQYQVTVRLSNPNRDAKGQPVDKRTFTIMAGAFVDVPALGLAAATGAVTVQVGQAMPNNPLASITSGGENALTVVEWGDGKVSALTRNGGAADAAYSGSQLTGSHIYNVPGTYLARVTVKDGTRLKVAGLWITVTSPSSALAFASLPVSAVERMNFTDMAVARVSDPNFASSGTAQGATIDWGDGDATTATIVPAGAGLYEIRGSHAFTEAGSRPLKIHYTSTYQNGGQPAAQTLDFGQSANVTAPAITVDPLTIPIFAGPNFDSALLTMFHVPATSISATSRDFLAYVDWGDGKRNSVSADDLGLSSSVVGAGTSFGVYGSHKYDANGIYTATIVITDTTMPTQSVVTSATIHVVDATAGIRSASIDLAEFKVVDGSVSGMTIDWGDGTVAKLNQSVGGVFKQTGIHRYSQPGHYQVTTTLDGHSSTRDIYVAGGDIQMPDITPVFGTDGLNEWSLPVAAFSSSDFSITESTFTARVNWGKGGWQNAQITKSPDGTFLVTADSPDSLYGDGSTLSPTVFLYSANQTFVKKGTDRHALTTRFVELRPDGTTAAIDRLPISDPAPVFSDVQISIVPGSIHTDETGSRIIANLQISGRLDDAMSGLTPGVEGEIVSASLFLNGSTTAESQPIVMTVSKSSGGSLAQPFAFFATFSQTVTVDLKPGENEVRLVAKNKLGYSGYAYTNVSVIATAPRDTMSVTLHFGSSTDLGGAATITLVYNDGGGRASASPITLSRQAAGNATNYMYSASTPLGSIDVTLNVNPNLIVDGTYPALLTIPGTNIDGDLWRLTMSNPAGGGTDFVGTRRVDPYETQSFSGYQFEIGESSPVETSAAGSFNPILIEVDGPADLRAHLDSVNFNGKAYKLVQYEGVTYVASGSDPSRPRAFVEASSNAGKKNGSAERRDGVWDFATGIGAGLYDTGFEIWDGFVSVASGTWYAVKNYNPYSISYRISNGQGFFTEEDQKALASGWKTVTSLADTVMKIVNKEATTVGAALGGDEDANAAWGAQINKGLEFAVETLQAVWDSIKNLDAYDYGRILGRIVGEATAAVVSAGVGSAIKSTVMPLVITKLKSVPYIAKFTPLLRKLEEMYDYFHKLATMHLCFVAGTPVGVPDGTRPIESLRPGDLVLARDERTGEVAYKPVLSTITTRPGRLFRVEYATGDGARSKVRGTGEHPFYVPSRGEFVPAKELKVGDDLLLAGGDQARVVAMSSEEALVVPFTTFNIEVADFHTYFVGDHHVWVHNFNGYRQGCEEIATEVLDIQKKEGGSTWSALVKLVKETENAFDPNLNADPKEIERLRKLRKKLDTNMDLAAHQAGFDAVKDFGADNSKKLRSVKEIYEDMGGRLNPDVNDKRRWIPKEGNRFFRYGLSKLHNHHVIPKEFHKILGIDPADTDNVPGFLLHKYMHVTNNKEVFPEEWQFHRILQQKMKQVRKTMLVDDKTTILNVLRESYHEWGNQFGDDFGTNLWNAAEDWLKGKNLLPTP